MTSACPVQRGESGNWVFTGYAEVLAATQDVEAFRANFRAPGVEVPPEEQFVNEIPEPRHGHVRKIINSAIASHRLTGVEPLCETLCRDLLTALRERGGQGRSISSPNTSCRCPTASSPTCSAPSPPITRSGRRGRKRSSRARTRPCTATSAGSVSRARTRSSPPTSTRSSPTGARHPREDFVTRLITREIDGRRLNDIEARVQLVFLFISGNETTRHLLGNLLHRLAGDPALFAELAADRKLVEAAIEESLRLDPPVRLLMRTCSAETVVAGEQIEVGEAVIFGVEQANRDEEKFDDPEHFRLDRPDMRRHLAFGGGPHVCPGAHLARMEARVAVNMLLDMAKGLRIEPGFAYENVPVVWAKGPRSVPVQIAWA